MPTNDPKVLQKNQQEETNKNVIARRNEIAKTMESYRQEIEKDKKENPDQYTLIEKCLKEGSLRPSSHGMSGLYYLKDDKEKTIFVVKAHDEALYSLNNRKTGENGIALNRTRVNEPIREAIHLYFEVVSESLFYEVTKLLDFEKYVPKTFIATITSKSFYDRKENPKSLQPKTKLCSVQTYMDNKGFINDSNAEQIEPLSFAVGLFLDCLLGQTDGNAENYLVCEQDNQDILLGIDKALCFPRENKELRMFNVRFKPAENLFPEKVIGFINRLSDENSQISQELYAKIKEKQELHAKATLPLYDKKKPQGNYILPEQYADNVITAMKERVEMMKWAIDRNMSMEEVCCRVIALEEGHDFAYRKTSIHATDCPSFNVGDKSGEEERFKFNQPLRQRMAALLKKAKPPTPKVEIASSSVAPEEPREEGASTFVASEEPREEGASTFVASEESSEVRNSAPNPVNNVLFTNF